MRLRKMSRWVRWLSLKGLPPDHIAHILDVDQADVDEVLALPCWMPLRPWRRVAGQCNGCMRGRVERMIELGHPADMIARSLGVECAAVIRCLSPPDPSRPIKGGLAAAVVRRHAAGEPVETIAAGLHLDLVNVERFLTRAFPAPRPPREPKPPRPPRPGSKADPERWRYLDAPDDDHKQTDQPGPGRPERWRYLDAPDDDLAVKSTAELVAVEVLDVGQAVADDGQRGEWDHFQETFKGRPKLTFDDAEAIRRQRADGATRPALARQWRVSLGTIDSILAGRTYRTPPPAEAMPPAIVAPDAPSCRPPRPATWRQAGKGRHLDPRYRDD